MEQSGRTSPTEPKIGMDKDLANALARTPNRRRSRKTISSRQPRRHKSMDNDSPASIPLPPSLNRDSSRGSEVKRRSSRPSEDSSLKDDSSRRNSQRRAPRRSTSNLEQTSARPRRQGSSSSGQVPVPTSLHRHSMRNSERGTQSRRTIRPLEDNSCLDESSRRRRNSERRGSERSAGSRRTMRPLEDNSCLDESSRRHRASSKGSERSTSRRTMRPLEDASLQDESARRRRRSSRSVSSHRNTLEKDDEEGRPRSTRSKQRGDTLDDSRRSSGRQKGVRRVSSAPRETLADDSMRSDASQEESGRRLSLHKNSILSW